MYMIVYIYINAHDNTLTYVVYIQHAAQNYISLYWTLFEKCRCLYNHATYVWIGSTIKTGRWKKKNQNAKGFLKIFRTVVVPKNWCRKGSTCHLFIGVPTYTCKYPGLLANILKTLQGPCAIHNTCHPAGSSPLQVQRRSGLAAPGPAMISYM